MTAISVNLSMAISLIIGVVGFFIGIAFCASHDNGKPEESGKTQGNRPQQPRSSSSLGAYGYSEEASAESLWLEDGLTLKQVVTIATAVTHELLSKECIDRDTIGQDVADITRSIVEALEKESSKRS